MPAPLRRFPWWLSLPLLYTAILLVFSGTGTVLQNWVTGSFILNVWVASVGLFCDPLPYSINRMFWIFMLVFMGMVPGIQVAAQAMPWGNDVSPVVYLTANMLVLACCGAYQLTLYIRAATVPERQPLYRRRVDVSLVKSYLTIGMAVLLVLSVSYFLMIGADALFLQKHILLKWRDRVPDGLYLLVEKAVRSPVLYFALLSVFLYRLRRISKRLMTMVLVLALLVNFPLAMPRTLAAAVVIGIVLSFGGGFWQRNRQAFTLLLLTGIFAIYPLLQAARWTSERMAADSPAMLYPRSFSSGDFDAYSMLCRTLSFTQKEGLQKGRQLQTALAFAVPRTYWPQKSIGSGAVVRRAEGAAFTNVACPLPAEGYIDFGWIGALLYVAFFAILAQSYDHYFWYWRRHRAAEGDLNFRVLFYPVMLILLFHLLRGDLLSGLAQLGGMYLFGSVFHQMLCLSPKWIFGQTKKP